MKHTDIRRADPSERAALPNAARRAVARFFHLDTSRRRPKSIEADAKLHASHVRPAPFRPELY